MDFLVFEMQEEKPKTLLIYGFWEVTKTVEWRTIMNEEGVISVCKPWP